MSLLLDARIETSGGNGGLSAFFLSISFGLIISLRVINRGLDANFDIELVSHGSANLGLVDLTLTTNEAPAEPWDKN